MRSPSPDFGFPSYRSVIVDREVAEAFAVRRKRRHDFAEVHSKLVRVWPQRRVSELLGKARIETVPTESMAAYDAYLRGRDFYVRYTRADNQNAIILFKKALEFDPSFALAYAGLGDAYAQGVTKFGFSPEWLDSAFAAARKSIELNPELAEGYKALGLAYMTNAEETKALEANKKAIEYNPNFAPAISNCGFVNLQLGRLDEAFRWF